MPRTSALWSTSRVAPAAMAPAFLLTALPAASGCNGYRRPWPLPAPARGALAVRHPALPRRSGAPFAGSVWLRAEAVSNDEPPPPLRTPRRKRRAAAGQQPVDTSAASGSVAPIEAPGAPAGAPTMTGKASTRPARRGGGRRKERAPSSSGELVSLSAALASAAATAAKATAPPPVHGATNGIGVGDGATAARGSPPLPPHVAERGAQAEYAPPPLPRVLMVHTGGTLGMDDDASYEPAPDDAPADDRPLRRGTGGTYSSSLAPGRLLAQLLSRAPEISTIANVDVKVALNVDSCRVGPKEWVMLARLLDRARPDYDAFVVIHGTDTMAYTAAALSLCLAGFRKPIIVTGSQRPLTRTRTDARQNLIDALTCATAGRLQEVALCFGGLLLRGNRSQKVSSTAYRAFDSPSHPPLAVLGVDVEWNDGALFKDPGVYRPRFNLTRAVLRVPIVPGADPRVTYGDLVARGVNGIVLEAFGVGNMPDQRASGWLAWLRSQRAAGLEVYLTSQCTRGPLAPELYRSGSIALEVGAHTTRMTPEAAVVKLMLCLSYPDLPPSLPIAGEL